MDKKIPFFYVNEGRFVQASHGQSLLEAIADAQISISHSCGGMGTCGTCRIVVEKGLQLLPARNELETEMAMDRGFLENERLACQTETCEGLHVFIPPGSSI